MVGGGGFSTRPLISSERQPLADVTTTDKEVKVIVEIPGISKENIKVNAYDNTVEVTTTDPQRKYPLKQTLKQLNQLTKMEFLK
jgi:HSP20 family protein